MTGLNSQTRTGDKVLRQVVVTVSATVRGDGGTHVTHFCEHWPTECLGAERRVVACDRRPDIRPAAPPRPLPEAGTISNRGDGN